MKTALVAIAKNEDNYIEEWVLYYLELGFDHIFVYMNDWKCNYEHPNLTLIDYPGKVKQVSAYNDFINQYKNEYDWAAFFDLDEFLVLKKHNNISDFLSNYLDSNGIGINWLFFGNNGIADINGNYNLVNRFTKRENKVNEHIKTILNLKKYSIMDVHCPNVPIIDTNKRLFMGPFNHNGNIDVAQLNHYFCKTQEEFNNKINRGRADAPIMHNPALFDACNHNDIDDFYAYNFINKKDSQ